MPVTRQPAVLPSPAYSRLVGAAIVLHAACAEIGLVRGHCPMAVPSLGPVASLLALRGGAQRTDPSTGLVVTGRALVLAGISLLTARGL